MRACPICGDPFRVLDQISCYCGWSATMPEKEVQTQHQRRKYAGCSAAQLQVSRTQLQVRLTEAARKDPVDRDAVDEITVALGAIQALTDGLPV